MSKQKKTLKITAVTALLLTICMVSVVVCSSITITGYNTVGSAYKTSYYYQAMTELQLTGDQRYDVMTIALSHVGYHTGDSDDEMDGRNILGWNSFVEFNRIFGKVDNNQGNGVSYGYYWCTCFVVWCMRQAGVTSSVIPTVCACRNILSHLNGKGLYATRASGYIPKCGDLVFFRNANSSNVTHVGFVLGVKGNTLYTVEGNANDHVTTRTHALNDTYIEGYGKVPYKTLPGMSYDFALAETDDFYWPYVHSQAVKVYSEPGTKNSVVYTIPANTVFDIYQIKSSWGKVKTPTGYGWCDISKTEPVFPTFDYAIKYYLRGGVGGKLDQLSYEGEAITIGQTPPVRNGYTFKGWAESPNGAVKYQPGDTYQGKKGDDLKELFAIWEANTYNVKYLDDDGNVILEKALKYGSETPKATAPAKADDENYRYKFKNWSPTVSPLVFGDAVYTPVYTQEKLVPDTTTAEETTKAPETDPPVTKPPVTDPPATEAETTHVTDTTKETVAEETTNEIAEDTETDVTVTESSEITDSAIVTMDVTETTIPDEITYEQINNVTEPSSDTSDVTNSTDTSGQVGEEGSNTPLIIAVFVLAAAAVITVGVIFVIKKKNA